VHDHPTDTRRLMLGRHPGTPSHVEPIPETIEVDDEFGPFSGEDLLRQLRRRSERVKELVPDCVGMTLSSRAHGVILTLVATSEEMAVLDAVQYLSGGPCVDSLESDRVMTYPAGDDLLDEEHWHHFARATAAAGVASTLTLPVITDGVVSGTINLYAAAARAFDGFHEPIARIFDAWAPGAVTNADLTFSTRKEAEQAPQRFREDMTIMAAVGILAASRPGDLQEARELLRDAALRAGVGEAELAASVIEIDGRRDRG
jgi:GAF domain-containing protein